MGRASYIEDEGTHGCERHRQASGKAPNFRAQENLFVCAQKFIFLRTKISRPVETALQQILEAKRHAAAGY